MPAPVNECVPLYRPGEQITGTVTADVNGKRFLKVTGGFESGPALNKSTLGGNIQVAHADAGGRVIGVANKDVPQGGKVTIVGAPGSTVPVIADGAVQAGDLIHVGSAGKAKSQSVISAAAAAASTGVIASNNALTYTAKANGSAGNTITVQILGSTGNSVALSVAVSGNEIVVTPATNSSGVITSTAAQVATAIAASTPANALVAVANNGASTGAGAVAAAGPVTLTGGADGGSGIAVGWAFNSAVDGADVFVRKF